MRESLADPARSENLCMCGLFMRENREIPRLPHQHPHSNRCCDHCKNPRNVFGTIRASRPVRLSPEEEALEFVATDTADHTSTHNENAHSAMIQVAVAHECHRCDFAGTHCHR